MVFTNLLNTKYKRSILPSLNASNMIRTKPMISLTVGASPKPDSAAKTLPPKRLKNATDLAPSAAKST